MRAYVPYEKPNETVGLHKRFYALQILKPVRRHGSIPEIYHIMSWCQISHRNTQY